MEAQQQQQCPPGCCTGTEILCISIPCPITIVLLGLQLNLELPCIRLTSGSQMSGAQVQQILGVLSGLLSGLGTSMPGAAAANAA